MSEKMEFKLPIKAAGSLAESIAAGAASKMAKTAGTPTSPANYDFLMRRASAVYEAQFEVIFQVRLWACGLYLHCSTNP